MKEIHIIQLDDGSIRFDTDMTDGKEVVAMLMAAVLAKGKEMGYSVEHLCGCLRLTDVMLTLAPDITLAITEAMKE